MPPSILNVLLAAAIFVIAELTHGQNYPAKPIHIVTAESGGGLDFTARLIAQGTSGPLGQQVVVENRGGAGGAIAISTVAKAPADGYTLLLYGSTLWLLPFMRENVPWDPIKDFSPVTLTNLQPNVLVVHPSLPVKTVKELIALAKIRRGDLNYGSAGLGSANSIAAELFKSLAGIDIVHVPFKGTAPAVQALLSGQVQVMFPVAPSAAPHVKSGKVRALAVTSAKPSPLFPDLPSVAAAGLPGYEAVSILGIFAPARTPAPIINRLNHEIVGAITKPDVKARFFSAGSEVVGSSPEELGAKVTSEIARLGKVIKDVGIRAD